MPDLYNDEERKKQLGLPQVADIAAPQPGRDQGLQSLNQGAPQSLPSPSSTWTPRELNPNRVIPEGEVEVIKGNRIVSQLPQQIKNTGDLMDVIRGNRLDQAPSSQMFYADPERAKMIEANRLSQIKSLSDIAGAQIQGQSQVEAARLRSEGNGQQALMQKMMAQQELQGLTGRAVKQFNDAMVGSGFANYDAKSDKYTATNPEYQKVMSNYAADIAAVQDKSQIPEITKRYQQTLADLSERVKFSDDKLLNALPDDFIQNPQFIPQIRNLLISSKTAQTVLPQDRLTGLEMEELQAKLVRGDKPIIAAVRSMQQQKNINQIEAERRARIQKWDNEATVKAMQRQSPMEDVTMPDWTARNNPIDKNYKAPSLPKLWTINEFAQ